MFAYCVQIWYFLRLKSLPSYRLDLRNANINNAEFEKIPESKRPDVILIRRFTDPATKQRRKHRRRRILSTGESVMETLTVTMEDVATDDFLTIDATETLGEVAIGTGDEEDSSDFSDVEFLDPEGGNFIFA